MAGKKKPSTPPRTRSTRRTPPASETPYAMTLVLQPEHKQLLDRLEGKLLDTRANICRRALILLAEHEGVRDLPS